MDVVRIPVDRPRDPDLLWNAPDGSVGQEGSRWRMDARTRIAGRITLSPRGEGGTFLVQVPLSVVDEVEVWHRERGGDWKYARAGDRVALSQWPFATQFPAFPVQVRGETIDLMVVAGNAAWLQVPVLLLYDTEFLQEASRRANVSGVMVGLGLMVLVICFLGALAVRTRASRLLVFVSAWALLAISVGSGYVAAWITPEATSFNDASKHFTAMMLAGLIVALVVQSLDLRHAGRLPRMLAVAAPVVSLAYAAAQVLWLPPYWRPPGAAIWASITLLCCIALCVISALKGARYVVPVAAGVACLLAAAVLPIVPPDLVAGVDLRSAFIALLIYSALLLFRQAQVARERHGRDVLSRAAVSMNRDPLTALLSLAGFELAYDEALLRQGAGGGVSSMMLFVLPGLEKAAFEHGFMVTERALVRFAAALHGALGEDWSIARLSKSRFVCISTRPQGSSQLAAQATQVLARCARITQPLSPLVDFQLRIACVRRRLDSDSLKALLHEMEKGAFALGEGKRIALLESQVLETA
jgi:GGDEF domain-containing protein